MAQMVAELRGQQAGLSRVPGAPGPDRQSSRGSSPLPGVVGFSQGPPAEQGMLGESHPKPAHQEVSLRQPFPGIVGVALGV